MDTIFLKELQARAVIGIFEWERRVRQIVLIDLEMRTDTRSAASSDRLEDTIDYKKISRRIKEFTESRPFNLIETLAEGIAAILINEFGVRESTVTVSKPRAIRGAKTVGVSIRRTG